MTGDAEYYTLEWRGRQTPPMDYAAILEALEAGDINSMYKINVQGRWRLLRDFLEDYTPPRRAASQPAYEPVPEFDVVSATEFSPPPEPKLPPAEHSHAAPAQSAHSSRLPASGKPKWPMYALIGLVVVLIPVCVIGGYVLLRAKVNVQAKPAETEPITETVESEAAPLKDGSKSLSIEELSDQKSSFVVQVESSWETPDKKTREWVRGKSWGSGVHIYNKEGYAVFVTNLHVVDYPEGARHPVVVVKFKDKVVPCEVIRIARYGIDLAKIRVKYPEGKAGPVLDTMKLDNLKVGQPCVAIGNALGFGISVTSGIISRFDEEQDCKFVRTSAPISPGNSGGALFRQKDGVLIGITTGSFGGGGKAQNVNLAIPVDYIFSDLFWLPLPD